MATTRIMPLHIGKGRTESRAISEIIDYVANPQKTDHGRLITGYECDSRVADAEFMLAKRQYIAATGRVRGADDVIAYHVRQSFCPGEITPEEANRLGVEFAKRFTKGKHIFIVCTVYLFFGVLICGCCGSRMTRKTNRVKGKEYHYYYCPTGKKHGCTNPVMLKESDLVECVKDSLKGYIDNVSCLQAILDGIDQSSINQALANEYASHIAANEQQVEQALEFKARLYESLITGTISKEEYTDYKAKYTRIAENAKESIRVLKEKLADVLENRSERNRWISHFTQFSTMETLDRKAVVHMIQSIKVIGKKELEITFTYQDEYQKAIQLIQLAEQTSQRKVG